MSARNRQRIKQQAARINKRYKQITDRMAGPVTESVMTEIISAIGTRANFYAPLDTSALINSQFREVARSGSGVRGRIGYTQNYAAALNDRDDWTPQSAQTRPIGTGGYNPNARPGYLVQGAGEAVARDLPALLLDGYKL